MIYKENIEQTNLIKIKIHIRFYAFSINNRGIPINIKHKQMTVILVI